VIAPPQWTSQDLDTEREQAEDRFREERGGEALELYTGLFDEYWGYVADFLEQTVDLTQLDEQALDLLSDPKKQKVFRYITGPPVSEDDLKVLAQVQTLSPQRLTRDPDAVVRLVGFLRDWHDRRRFPWLSEEWEPQEHSRNAAILATTALLAMREVETIRRNGAKAVQERMVYDHLREAGLQLVPRRTIRTLNQAPAPGQFCEESKLGTRKADFIIGLWDGRTMPLECKVSNSQLNSIKRLNNDAAVKAEHWRSDFGTVQVVPAAVLGGCYSLQHLEDAQQRGLTLFWAHALEPLISFINMTRQG